MFFLDRDQFHGLNVSLLTSFVTSWERYYRDPVSVYPGGNQPIDYLRELNLSGDLTAENVTRLLRWKDPRMLTHPKVSGGGAAANEQVVRVLEELHRLNEFRRGEMDEKSFEAVTKQVFPSGFVWPLFLFHIARPWEWPIGDQHVFRAYTALFGVQSPETFADFRHYRRSFSDLAGRLMLSAQSNAERSATVASNKRLDNALMAYGQFLDAYDR
ncbi:MAG TPA: hypothetical protein VHZ99_07635 [Steroidobacteraceae bacterium]|jgi:hypothetical protein|nr:hypothetical protein [Steroidobacteraceae bacterium]